MLPQPGLSSNGLVNKSMEYFPIATVADHYDLPISTLHHWERQNLLVPHRRAGRRVYNRDQVYRIALIKLWRTTGRLGLTDIGAVLDRETEGEWRAIISARMRALEAEMETLAAAHEYLRTLLECRQHGDPARCPGFRASVSLPASANRRE